MKPRSKYLHQVPLETIDLKIAEEKRVKKNIKLNLLPY